MLLQPGSSPGPAAAHQPKAGKRSDSPRDFGSPFPLCLNGIHRPCRHPSPLRGAAPCGWGHGSGGGQGSVHVVGTRWAPAGGCLGGADTGSVTDSSRPPAPSCLLHCFLSRDLYSWDVKMPYESFQLAIRISDLSQVLDFLVMGPKAERMRWAGPGPSGRGHRVCAPGRGQRARGVHAAAVPRVGSYVTRKPGGIFKDARVANFTSALRSLYRGRDPDVGCRGFRFLRQETKIPKFPKLRWFQSPALRK